MMPEGASREILADLKKQARRATPFDLARMSGPSTTVQVYQFALPNGWRAKLPPDIEVNGILGRTSTRYFQSGNILKIEHTRVGVRGIAPADKKSEIMNWLEAATKESASFIILEKGA
jgi:hypothetical protein